MVSILYCGVEVFQYLKWLKKPVLVLFSVFTVVFFDSVRRKHIKMAAMPGSIAHKNTFLKFEGSKLNKINADNAPKVAPKVSMLRCRPNTRPLFCVVHSSANKASRAPVRSPLPNRSAVRVKNTHTGCANNIVRGFAAALSAYPQRINGTRFWRSSDSLPKYPLLTPAVSSAAPSKKPINAIVKPMCLRYNGMTGYSISLAISVNKLISESIQTRRVTAEAKKMFLHKLSNILFYSQGSFLG